MDIKNNGGPVATAASARSDPHTKGHTFEAEKFSGHVAVRLDDSGNPTQVSIVMIGEGKRFTPYVSMMAGFITFLLEEGIPMQKIYMRYDSLRSLSAPSGMTATDSTEDAIFNCVMRWLGKEFKLIL